jgi:hypothetical protein
MSPDRRKGVLGSILTIGAVALAFATGASGQEHRKTLPLPSYHYGAKIPVTCLNRSM